MFSTMVKLHRFFDSLLRKKSVSKLDTDASVLPASEQARTSNNIAIRQNDGLPTGGGYQLEVSAVANDTVLAHAKDSPDLISSMPNEQIRLANSIMNNVQYNAHSSTRTAISNSGGIHVFQLKNTRNVHIGDNFFVQTAHKQNQLEEVKWKKLKQSHTIMHLMHSSIDIDNEVLEIVSRHLGYEWKSFARKLGYSRGQIDAFEEDNRNLSEQIYNFISDWYRSESNPTLGKLVSLLWKNEHKETVYHIKQAWKKRKNDLTSLNKYDES
ncbi:protein immune deficiency [Anopheles aquasalis]|uniref:protein immune deficiency n=1 Tax=Anopheles aquasalis TaxID=42839 RepID=UPI00215A46EB|nr:protein immune deficiency [Anopheles aquasalis]